MDTIRRYFEKQHGCNAVLLGDFTNHISVHDWEVIKEHMNLIQDKTGLKIIITEFFVDCHD